jgi:hypothetical protein
MTRLAGIVVLAALLCAACSAETSAPSTAPSAPASTSSAAPKPLTWGDKATTIGVDVSLAKPVVAGGYATTAVTITNHAAGGAQVTYSGRVGGEAADWYADPSTPEVPVQPGETVTTKAKFKLPDAPSGNLAILVQVNIGGQPNGDQPVFSGPLS